MPVTKADYDMMAYFEKIYGKSFRMDKEEKSLWNMKHIYQHPVVNELFLAFRNGVAYGKRCTEDN